MSALTDRFGRVHDYLRISVTDRCNLRCLYCMPEEGVKFEPAENLLSYDQIAQVVRAGAELGISKLRITGGEPLVRPGLPDLVRELASIPGIRDISLTTNGVLLADQAEALRAAGLRRVNISLDTLDPARFRFIARRGDLQRVLQGIEAAAEAGFSPIKLNCVLLKGINEDEIAAFLEMAVKRPLHVRFIEYMPIGHADDNWRNHYLPLSRVLEIAKQNNLEAEPMTNVLGNGPSEDFRIKGGAGTFGLIHPISDQFCARCNRLRLTADGNLQPCLYWVDELNVKSALGSPEALEQLFLRALDMKPRNHEMAAKLADEALTHEPTARRMSQIGG
ncbi:GTP 3',8-cyclase MoaA [Paenibacillus sacheonensis]|uniref:GTP 3',8-cyclase n=1 Tax=Paenibacillus sacheonensis TaxID=742054 RepID=A0A7X4YNL4_9BACL|nr:GTP 3',8-cyclase MoaA [Paenibacillus sacheonensis]MBM7565392.1 cyclic pyranopterin phosphate synthase [Paenibacillus sacheonensis]NBC69680.1 GTP 3',8-cyclase MoaA [Paenibacillus sacheonensis]